MEVVAATPASGGVPPFHDHDVREWSRLDSITGVLERARLETDHWSAKTNNSCHKYGKVVDSRARTNADGALQQKARRQLEVFQSQIAGGQLQVIKTHTVSSSRWSSSKTSTSGDFENLQLSLNSLDLSSQKSKANVGRSVGRRPPSRPRVKDESHHNNPSRNVQETAANNLYRVSRLCHQIHDNAVKQTFGNKYHKTISKKSPSSSVDDEGGIEIVEIDSVHSNNTNESSETIITNGNHRVLTRTKSNSSEDLHNQTIGNNRSIDDLEDLEQLQSWRRSSKLRRSLQYPHTNHNSSPKTDAPVELENTGSVRRIREELEKGRRLSTALRGNNVDLEALDQILQSISSNSNSSTESDKVSIIDDILEKDGVQSISNKKKRDSFVSVASLQEVRGRLRRTSSSTNCQHVNNNHHKDEEIDDGIVTEDMPSVSESSSPKTRVRSYVYGMEALINNNTTNTNKPVLGTGSLESRSKLLNGNANIRNEDWYNRRKSYGFEQVHPHDESPTASSSLKSRVESSTDSGICRSSEIVLPLTRSEIFSDSGGTGCNNFGNVKKISSIFDQSTASRTNFNNKDWKEGDNYKTKSDLQSTTITIPIVSSSKQPNFVDFTWDDKPEKDIKRHSIAVDETKYVASTHDNNEPKFRRTSLAINESRFVSSNGDSLFVDSQNRKLKKVEFCKTEVHFAAESGKVNIVETDEKPPPTNNFRRRRRNSGPTIDSNNERNGLPILHFGDSSYEKSLLGVSDTSEEFTIRDDTDDDYQSQPSSVGNTVTVNSSFNNIRRQHHMDFIEDGDNIKGILKNKPIKPTPYHLGEYEIHSFFNSNQNSDSDSSGKWGVRLKPIPKSETPYWKSTVTLHNTVFDQESQQSDTNQPEFQRLLKNLRPTNQSVKPDLINTTQPISDGFPSGIQFTSLPEARHSWSKSSDDNNFDQQQCNDQTNKYSTKISFRDGSTTVIENDHGADSRWIKKECPVKDSKQILNRGLVVRIGREDYTSTMTTMTTHLEDDRNNTTTTTKITIDLTPSPTIDNPKDDPFLLVPRANKCEKTRSHSFKSTSLILDTINGRTNNDIVNTNNNNNTTNNKLEALKKLYEDVQSDSDADKEVQVLMGELGGNDVSDFEDDDDVSSVVSGSWSRMRAFKQIHEHVSKTSHIREIPSVRLSAKIEKGDVICDGPKRIGVFDLQHGKTIQKPQPNKESPVGHRLELLSKRSDLKTAITSEKLSSPSLVGRNSSKLDLTSENSSQDQQLQDKYIKSDVVLRQPKRSEMTYFGVPPSPKIVRKSTQPVIERRKIDDKPDLLQHMTSDKSTKSSTRRSRVAKLTSERLPSPKSRDSKVPPIYENVTKRNETKSVKNNRNVREFDSSILEELTKAADQILQAVNGFTDDDQNRLSDGDEEIEPLATISEIKSWSNQDKKKSSKSITTNQKTRLKHASSTSSVDSINNAKDVVMKRSTPTRRSAQNQSKTVVATSTSSNERLKKTSTKTLSTTSTSKATRRLQRASSREALLQSHGSSSEDLGTQMDTPLRKPRQIKKTKAMQLTITNGIEMSHKKVLSNPSNRRRKDESKTKTEEPTIRSEVLPDIRHKTAVSTNRSTTEKSSRDRSKTRNSTSNTNQDLDSTKRRVAANHHQKRGGVTGSVSRSDPTNKLRNGTASIRETVNHRISTANIKKCQRSDGTSRH